MSSSKEMVKLAVKALEEKKRRRYPDYRYPGNIGAGRLLYYRQWK